MALPKGYRLSKNEFKRVFEKGKTVKSSFFFINFLKNNSDHVRLATAVPAKIFKKATVRNKFRRIVADVVKKSYLYTRPFDLVIIATEVIVGKTAKEIKGELEKTIDKKFVN
jgi:ribonuclease P protein component